MIDPATTLPELQKIALTNRPELASQGSLVQAAEARIRRERGRILLPSILINGFQTPDELIQAGIFGMGPNNKLNQWTGRDDLSQGRGVPTGGASGRALPPTGGRHWGLERPSFFIFH